ncbi:MAG: tRNA preQ1(34) S-adenosylmethionine ribosyltransferase-isomerase QueA [Alphaproteobacteria bacterium]
MKLSDFDFNLPRELIATRPMEPREAARLLEVRQDGAPGEGLNDCRVADLPDLLRAGDVVVVNDTRVVRARLKGRRGDAKVEITLHKPLSPSRWHAFAKGARKLRAGDVIVFAEGFAANVAAKGEEGEVELEFALPEAEILAALERHGSAPLPPYIARDDGPDERDIADYQTVFAVKPGAVAAPTAGFHFTEGLLRRLLAKGVERATLTLHVGAGTFLPVKTEDVKEHRMHAEWGEIDAFTAEFINRARDKGGRVIAIGTTALRMLETAAVEDGRLRAFSGDTDIFITPGYRFRAVDLLLTNFHLPRSTLFMLVAAFAGLDRMKAAYAHAMARRYRFYSYGDCCLLHPAPGVRVTDL